jgi:phosphate transport system permease protein
VSSSLFRSHAETGFAVALWTSALLASTIIGAIVVVTAIGAAPAVQQVGLTAFATDPSWHPTAGTFNLMPMLAGTSLVALGATALAGPIGVISAVFCHHYAPTWLATSYRLLLRALAGIPSVVYGLWGLVVLVPLLTSIQPPGASLLAGILVLALMILPTVAVLADGAVARVPPALYQGGAALGIPRHRLILQIVLPSARSGLAAAIVMGVGRALGETMAVLMVTGNVVQFPTSAFSPIRSLAANIALEMAYAMNVHRSALFVSGLVLVLLVTIVLSTTEWIASRETQAHE